MTIKNLVISGGGPIMLQILGAIQFLEKNKFLDINNIETIYGTSAGAMIGLCLCLKFDWETINDYFIKRPWQEVFSIKVENIFDAYTRKGIFDIKTIEKCYKPLFDAKDIPIDINLEELYNLSKIELHMFTFEINEYKTQDISYLTHPKLSVLTAIQMSCALPILITPVFLHDKCYIDGGVSCNYPLKYCIDSGKNADETLGFKINYGNNKNIIGEEATILDFLFYYLFKAIFSVNTDNIQPVIKNEVLLDVDTCSVTFHMFSALTRMEDRKEWFNNGIKSSANLLTSLEYSIQELSESFL
jgi:predicted acylesterase/phospholipase RssA